MSFDYIRSQATANRLISRFGKSADIIRYVETGVDYDPTLTETLYPCTIVELEYSSKDIDGTRIQRGDKMIYVATQGLLIVPTTADKIQINGLVYSIIGVDTLEPADTIVFWTLQVRN